MFLAVASFFVGPRKQTAVQEALEGKGFARELQVGEEQSN